MALCIFLSALVGFRLNAICSFILVNKVLAEVKFTDRKSALQQKPQKVKNGLMPFVTQYNPSVPNLKNILMSKWHLIENQPMLREIYRDPPLISYRRGKSLKDILVRANL